MKILRKITRPFRFDNLCTIYCLVICLNDILILYIYNLLPLWFVTVYSSAECSVYGFQNNRCNKNHLNIIYVYKYMIFLPFCYQYYT